MGSPNFEQLPINRPRNGVHNNNRDGAGQQFIHKNIYPYSENSLNNGSPRIANFSQGNGFFTAPARKVVDAHYVREVSPTFLDHWSQPRLFYNSLLPEEQQMVINAARFELSKVNPEVRRHAIGQLNRISHDLATRVAAAFNTEAPAEDPTYYHDNKTEGVSVFKQPLKTIASLNVGIVIAEGGNLAQAQELKKQFKEKKANPSIIAPTNFEGVDVPYAAAHAVLYDTIILVGQNTEQQFKTATTPLGKITKPVELFKDAYTLGKPVGVIGWKDASKTLGLSKGKKAEGVYVGDRNVNGFVDQVEGGLKTFKFLGRFEMDQK